MNRTASPLSRTAKVTVALLFVIWLVDYFDRLIMTFALPYIGKEFHLDHTQEGLLISAFFIAYAFSQLPGGVLADKVVTRKIIAIAMIVWSVFTGFTGLAWSFGALLVIRFFFGIGEGVFPQGLFKVEVTAWRGADTPGRCISRAGTAGAGIVCGCLRP